MSEIGRHSAKPAIIRDKIVELLGDVPRIELFAREKAPGAEEEGRLLDNEVDDLQCPFLEFDENGLSRCAIYEHRPEICRLFGKGGHPFLTCPNNPLVDISEH